MSEREHPIQVSIKQFLDVALPPGAIYFAVPNGGHLVAKERKSKAGKTFRLSLAAIKLKREGMKNGVADLIVIDPRPDGPCVIGLEVKTTDGRPSQDQKDWRRDFEAAGGLYAIARSMEDAAAALTEFGVKLRAIPSSAPGRLYEKT
jgi:hypothetical protein